LLYFGFYFGVVGFFKRFVIQLRNHIKHFSPVCFVNTIMVIEVQHRIFTTAELNALVHRIQEAIAP